MIDIELVLDVAIIISILLGTTATVILAWVNISIFSERIKNNKSDISRVTFPSWHVQIITNDNVLSNSKPFYPNFIELYLDIKLESFIGTSTKTSQAIHISESQEYTEKYSHSKNKSTTFVPLPWSHA